MTAPGERAEQLLCAALMVTAVAGAAVALLARVVSRWVP